MSMRNRNSQVKNSSCGAIGGITLVHLVHAASSFSSSSSSSTHVHAHASFAPSIPPSSLHSFACKYASWLFLSVFFQKLPGEIRVEKPIACSQQIKEAGASSNDVTDNLPYGVQGKGRMQFGVHG